MCSKYSLDMGQLVIYAFVWMTQIFLKFPLDFCRLVFKDIYSYVHICMYVLNVVENLTLCSLSKSC